VRMNGEGYLRDWRILSLDVYPMQYQPLEGRLVLHSDITLTISYSGGQINTQAEVSSYDPFYQLIRSYVDNPEDTSSFKIPQEHRPLLNDDETEPPSPTRGPPQPSLQQASYKYVIVTSSSLWNNFQPLVNWKTSKGVRSIAVNTSWIYSNYGGSDAQKKIRAFISDAVTTWQTDYVLLGGDVGIVPYRGCYGSAGSQSTTNIPTDYYYCNLDGNWNSDNDNIFGETNDNVDLYPDVFLGRAPTRPPRRVSS